MSEKPHGHYCHCRNQSPRGNQPDKNCRTNVQIKQYNGDAERGADDRRIREQLAELNANLQQLADDMRTDRAHQTEILTAEVKGLSQSIAAFIGTSSIAKRGK